MMKKFEITINGRTESFDTAEELEAFRQSNTRPVFLNKYVEMYTNAPKSCDLASTSVICARAAYTTNEGCLNYILRLVRVLDVQEQRNKYNEFMAFSILADQMERCPFVEPLVRVRDLIKQRDLILKGFDLEGGVGRHIYQMVTDGFRVLIEKI